jgi:chemotaxis protein CheX
MKPIPGTVANTVVRPDASWKVLLECAAAEVFEIMAGERSSPWPSPNDEPSGDMTAMIGLAGGLCGILAVRCSRKMAEHVAARMLPGESIPTPGMIGDAMGEVCNMIAGNFKAKIAGVADNCMLSVPTVITGEDYVMYPVDAGENFPVVLQVFGAPVWITLTLHS